MASNPVTLRIQCPCGYYDLLHVGVPDRPQGQEPSIAADREIATAAIHVARLERWHRPTIDSVVDGKVQARGQCYECFTLEHESF